MNEDTLYRIIALVLMAPLWIPVIKALYTDFQGALWEEGGLFGRPPGKKQLQKLRDRYGDYESPLINEPHAPRGFKDRSKSPVRTGTGGGDAAPSKRGF